MKETNNFLFITLQPKPQRLNQRIFHVVSVRSLRFFCWGKQVHWPAYSGSCPLWSTEFVGCGSFLDEK